MPEKIKIAEYSIDTQSRLSDKTLVLLADIHGSPDESILSQCEKIMPDIIAVAGDLMTNLGLPGRSDELSRGFEFLCRAAAIAPTFYSLGNHERGVTEENRRIIRECGAVLLDNDAIEFQNMWIGGLSSGYGKNRQGHLKSTPPPDLDWLRNYDSKKGYKILLSHHPEYYPVYIRRTTVDLVLSGHAHGGQWRFFGHGIFAPGQGVFPKYTSGVYENRLIVSPGLSNTAGMIPRLFNPKEIIVLHLK